MQPFMKFDLLTGMVVEPVKPKRSWGEIYSAYWENLQLRKPLVYLDSMTEPS